MARSKATTTTSVCAAPVSRSAPPTYCFERGPQAVAVEDVENQEVRRAARARSHRGVSAASVGDTSSIVFPRMDPFSQHVFHWWSFASERRGVYQNCGCQ